MAAVRCVCVFCGSLPGNDPRFADLGAEVGRHLAEAGLTIVYGGGEAGLMGALADAATGSGGKVIGVIPSFLRVRERDHRGVSEMIETEDMHTRRVVMHERSDAFVALPGGIGTLEETVEVLSWITLDLHAKPVILVDSGYWSPLLTLLEHMDDCGFSHQSLGKAVSVADTPESLITLLREAGS